MWMKGNQLTGEVVDEGGPDAKTILQGQALKFSTRP